METPKPSFTFDRAYLDSVTKAACDSSWERLQGLPRASQLLELEMAAKCGKTRHVLRYGGWGSIDRASEDASYWRELGFTAHISPIVTILDDGLFASEIALAIGWGS